MLRRALNAVVSVTMILAIPLASQTRKQGVNKNHTQEWKEYVYAVDGFAMTLPKPPVPPHKDSQMPDGTAYSVHLSDELTVGLHVGNFPDGCAQVFDAY